VTAGSAHSFADGARRLAGDVQRFGLVSAAGVVDRYVTAADRALGRVLPTVPPTINATGASRSRPFGGVPVDEGAVAESAAVLARAWVQMLALATGVLPGGAARPSESAPVVLPAVRPGEATQASLWLHQPAGDVPAPAATSMVGPPGASLPADAVAVAPAAPPGVAADGPVELRLRVAVPREQRPGRYRGLVVVPPDASLPVVLEVLPE
jgi:hypothetical protein